MTGLAIIGIVAGIVVTLALIIIFKSITLIGPAQIGLVNKRFARKRLGDDDPIAFHGEAGYQAQLLMPGLRFKFWPVFTVSRFPWVQVPAGEIGVVIAQVGGGLPIGAKSAVYKAEFGNFADIESFVVNGGQKGVQRPVLPPGTLLPIHPVGFMVLTVHKASTLRSAAGIDSAEPSVTRMALRARCPSR